MGCHSEQSGESPDKNIDENLVSEEYEGDAWAGKSLYVSCAVCHGDQAQGNQQLSAPALVNGDAWYLKRQLHNFKNGIRGKDKRDSLGIQMATMAMTLSDSKAIADVVAYIKSFTETKTQKTVVGDIPKGGAYYHMICGACHGKDAVGIESLNAPVLSGIDDWYLESSVHKFVDGVRGAHPDDKFGAQMREISISIPNDETIKNVVAFIQSTQDHPIKKEEAHKQTPNEGL